MTKHGYENGRLNLPFVGICTFGKYSYQELRLIFIKIVKEGYWDILSDDDISVEFFKKNMDYFTFNGGDMLTLFGMCKKAHAIRLLEIEDETELLQSKKLINKTDLENGMKIFLKNPEYAKRKKGNDTVPMMYM